MLGEADLKLCSMAVLLVLGMLANVFNLGIMLVQQWRCRGVETVAIIICFISLGNILLQISTFVLVVCMWAGVLCELELPFFFCVVVVVWLSSSSVSFWSIAWLSFFYCVRVLSFSWVLFRALKRNISAILNVLLCVTLLTSSVMFTPFFYLHLQSQTLLPNMTDSAACDIRKTLFPAWVNVNAYMIIFICYLTLMPLTVMLSTSLWLVVFLCRHSLSSSCPSAESYLLVCRLTIALVGVYLTTLLTISLYYFHAIFASGLSADVLFLGLSIYCVASAILLTCSNKNLREKLRGICRGKNINIVQET